MLSKNVATLGILNLLASAWVVVDMAILCNFFYVHKYRGYRVCETKIDDFERNKFIKRFQYYKSILKHVQVLTDSLAKIQKIFLHIL